MFKIFIRRTKEGRGRPRWGTIITALLALYLLKIFIWPLFDSQIEIRGDVAYKKLEINSEIRYLDVVAVKSAETAYYIAGKYKQINKIVISVYIKQWYTRSGKGVHAWSEEIPVAKVVVENLAEVRQYKNAQEYVSAKSSFYKNEIRRTSDPNRFY